MGFYFLITAVTIALAGLMDAVWTRSVQMAGSVARRDGQAAGSAAFDNSMRVCAIAASGNGTRACCSPAFGSGLPGGVSRRRAFDIVCLTAIFFILAGVSALRLEVGNDYGKYVENFHEI